MEFVSFSENLKQKFSKCKEGKRETSFLLFSLGECKAVLQPSSLAPTLAGQLHPMFIWPGFVTDGKGAQEAFIQWSWSSCVSTAQCSSAMQAMSLDITQASSGPLSCGLQWRVLLSCCLTWGFFVFLRSSYITFEWATESKPILTQSLWPQCKLNMSFLAEHQPPYIIAVLPRYVEIRTLEPRLLVQSIELQRPRFITSGGWGVSPFAVTALLPSPCTSINPTPSYQYSSVSRSNIIYVASNHFVWRLIPVPMATQIQQLLQDKQFELALQLAVSLVP